jgi:CHAT domain-containing protein
MAKLTMSTPTPEGEAKWREAFDLEEQVEVSVLRRLGQAGSLAAGAPPWVELDAIRKQLGKAVLIEIARFEPLNFSAKGDEKKWLPARYVAWIIPPVDAGEVRIVDLGEARLIDRAVAETRKNFLGSRQERRRGLVSEDAETDREKAVRNAPAVLARLVLWPILKQVGSANRLIISPDANLWLVPWGALPVGKGTYAIEKYEIDYMISSRDLAAPSPRALSASEPVVMADPDYDLSLAAIVAVTEPTPEDLIADLKRRAEAPEGTVLEEMKPVVRKPAAPAAPVPPRDQVRARSASAESGPIGHADRLPGTAKEARAIAPQLAAYAQAEPKLYLEQEALEGNFKTLVRPKVLVLSTHGFFLPDQPLKPDNGAGKSKAADGARGTATAAGGRRLENPLLRCGLLLAGSNNHNEAGETWMYTDDGILTGIEIVGTDLRGTKLVVLSACETGLGDVQNGEGVAGLRQAFQLAGAEAVVASLWQIPDEQTAELMGLFFTNLAAGKARSAALRRAQLAMIEAHRDEEIGWQPFYWAAFTMTERKPLRKQISQPKSDAADPAESD